MSPSQCKVCGSNIIDQRASKNTRTLLTAGFLTCEWGRGDERRWEWGGNDEPPSGDRRHFHARRKAIAHRTLQN